MQRQISQRSTAAKIQTQKLQYATTNIQFGCKSGALQPNIFHFVKSCSAFSDVGEKQGKIFHTLFSVWWGWPKIGQIDWNDTCARAVSCNFCCQVAKLRLRKPQQSTHWKILFMRVRSQIETGSWRSNFIASAKLSLELHCIALLSLERRYARKNIR